MNAETFPSLEELQEKWEQMEPSQRDSGRLDLIVRRPAVDEREVLTEGILNPAYGLVGDIWNRLGHSPNPARQLTLMNSRVIALLAQERARWSLAGDQLFVDLDLSLENLPPGARLRIGSAIVEISALPHTGCSKFASRFGDVALQFINAPELKILRLRGVNARIVKAGTIRAGDMVEVVRTPLV